MGMAQKLVDAGTQPPLGLEVRTYFMANRNQPMAVNLLVETGTALTFETSIDRGQSWQPLAGVSLGTNGNVALLADRDYARVRCVNPAGATVWLL